MRKTRVILSMEHGDTENDIKRRHRAQSQTFSPWIPCLLKRIKLYAPFHSSQTVKPCATTPKGDGSQLQRKTTRNILHAFTAQQSTVIQKFP